MRIFIDTRDLPLVVREGDRVEIIRPVNSEVVEIRVNGLVYYNRRAPSSIPLTLDCRLDD